MKASVIYRVTAVLLLLFAAGHLLGFSQSDPKWGVDPILAAMRSTRFDVTGSSRTLWDFYLAGGQCVGVFYLFSAVLAWRLGSLPQATLQQMPVIAWAFALSFAAIAAITWVHLFIIPIAFATLITLCLAAAAWLTPRQG